MRILSLLWCLVLAASCASAQKVDARSWAKISRYAEANDTATVSPTFVFMGNSIIDFWPGAHPGFFADNDIVGRGISGQTSAQMLLRFMPDVVSLHPKAVLILAGINDIAENAGPYSEDFTMSNIDAMVSLARSAGITPILAAVLPAAEIYWNKDVTLVPEKIQSLNSHIKCFAVEQGIACVDWYPALLAADGRTINSAFSDDGLHPNAEGYAVMEAIVQPVLASFCE